MKYGTSHKPGEEGSSCSHERQERELRESGWARQAAAEVAPKAAAEKAAQGAALLEAEAEEFRRQKEEEDSLRGFVRALGLRRAPKS